MGQIEALVTPSVMKWSREQAGLDIATAAKKLDRPEDDIRNWENGTLRPTLPQARKASEVYKRSIAVFYLPEPPRDFQSLRDFRRLPDQRPTEYSPELALLIRQVQYRQQWLREWREYQREERLTYVGSANLSLTPEAITESIRTIFTISPADQISCSTRRDALLLWISRAEDVGITVCRSGGIECEEARGFVLTDEFAPCIYLNSNDGIAAQLFTLLHELAHIWLNQPGISNLEELDRSPSDDASKIEVFCSRIAAETLLDAKTFDSLWRASTSTASLAERIERVSQSAKVSEEVVARRLLDRGTITVEKYRDLRRIYIARWKQLQKEEKERNQRNKGGPSPHLLRVLANGRMFTQTVISAYHGGNISGGETSDLLHAKLNNLPKIAEWAGVLIRSRRQDGGR